MDLSDRCPYCRMPLSPYATHCPHCTQNILDRWYWCSPPSNDGTFRSFAAGPCAAMYSLTYMITSGHGPGRSLLVALATVIAVWIGVSLLAPAAERKVCTLIVMPAVLAVGWFVVRYLLPFLFELIMMIWNS